jgi:hypothetical protein
MAAKNHTGHPNFAGEAHLHISPSITHFLFSSCYYNSSSSQPKTVWAQSASFAHGNTPTKQVCSSHYNFDSTHNHSLLNISKIQYHLYEQS